MESDVSISYFRGVALNVFKGSVLSPPALLPLPFALLNIFAFLILCSLVFRIPTNPTSFVIVFLPSLGQQIVRDMFHVWLYSRRSKLSIVSQMMQIIRILLKSCFFNFSLFNSSSLSSLVLASRMASLVTALGAS